MADRSGERLIADNRKARHDFHLFDTYEAGIVLLGTEVKAIREGRVNLRDSYGRIEGGEVFLCNVHISPYSHRGRNPAYKTGKPGFPFAREWRKEKSWIPAPVFTRTSLHGNAGNNLFPSRCLVPSLFEAPVDKIPVRPTL